MNNQQQYFSESIITSVSSIIDNSPYENNFLCSSLRSATQVCGQKKCQKMAFICQNSTCDCRLEHTTCLIVNIESLINRIKPKIVSVKSLETCINDRIQQIVDFLSDFQQKTLNQIKQDFQLYGLNPQQKQFFKIVKDGKLTKTTGSKIWSIIRAEQQKQVIENIIEESQKSLQRVFKDSLQTIKEFTQKFTLEIKECAKMQNYFITSNMWNYFRQKNQNNVINNQIRLYSSKIISSLIELKTLQGFFTPRKLKSAKLLYRASEHNFDIKKFHQKCDGIPDTLVLVETQFSKKIGGYNPNKWSSVIGDCKFKLTDSFTFSLTNADKFKPADNEG